MPTPPVIVAEFKARFVRDFVYGSTADKVMDADITNALNGAMPLFNSGLWADTQEVKTAFFFVAAHFLYLDVQAAGGLSATNLGLGLEGQSSGPVQSNTVGPVSQTYVIPESVQKDPMLSGFMRTPYGQRYLELLAPRLVGNVGVAIGRRESDAV